MLTKCPECDLQVSDKAINCPHCGFPLSKPRAVNQSVTKHKRLPNGFGQIVKISRLRNPYRVMVPTGLNKDGKYTCKLLKPVSYFRTYNEAYEALVEYHKNPYDLDNFITVEELYTRWSTEYFKTLKSESSSRTVISAWRYCTSVYNLPVKELKARHIKYCMENGIYDGHTPSPGTKSRIKSIFNLMLDYALEYEIVDKNYARTFNISENIVKEVNKAKTDHISFTDEEIRLLWENKNIPYVDIILIQCYSGLRPQELGLIKLENVNIKENYMIGGMKTEAGTNRTIPIHPCIKELITKRYEEAKAIGSEYLLNVMESEDKMLTYDKYRKRFIKVIKLLNINEKHRAHDPRKHFVTLAKKYNVDEYAIKRIVGHAIDDITEKTYTDRDFNWLYDEIKKIKSL